MLLKLYKTSTESDRKVVEHEKLGKPATSACGKDNTSLSSYSAKEWAIKRTGRQCWLGWPPNHNDNDDDDDESGDRSSDDADDQSHVNTTVTRTWCRTTCSTTIGTWLYVQHFNTQHLSTQQQQQRHYYWYY